MLAPKEYVSKRYLLAVTVFLLVASLLNPYIKPLQAYQGDSRLFTETGKSVKGKFLQYWNAHGGLAQQGYPISNEMQEQSDIDGWVYTVQYFERAVFELHAENVGTQYEVLLSLLGSLYYTQKYPSGAPDQNVSNDNVIRFQETGKTLGGRFRAYWEKNGGLPQQGFPISDEFQETNELDGKTYTVQYFERSVLEYHPENTGTQYDVLLSQLGTFRYGAKYGAQTTSAQNAQDYLREALDYIQENSIMVSSIDWVTLRKEAIELAQDAQTTADTYPAIRYALQNLGDNHSRLIEPDQVKRVKQSRAQGTGLTVTYADREITDVEAGGPAEQAGVLIGDVIETVNGAPASTMGASAFFADIYGGTSVQLSLKRVGKDEPIFVAIGHNFYDRNRIPQGRRLAGNIGYIEVPILGSGEINEQYATIAQEIIRDVDRTGACGWVVDLQRNSGGSIYPMLAGIGPILGEGDAGAFILAKGEQIVWAYRDGKAFYADQILAQVRVPYQLKQSTPPVAVLTSRLTASAGEAILISFRGLAGIRSFGEPTYGVPSGNEVKELSDGAWLVLTAAREADRTGHIYGHVERIEPDQAVQVDLGRVGTDDDPVLQTAVGWVQNQPACRP